jgi:hypothetical protein
MLIHDILWLVLSKFHVRNFLLEQGSGLCLYTKEQAVPKQVPTVKLTQIQLATLNDMRQHANTKGVLSASLRNEYKQNVVGALIARGVLTEYVNGSVRITNTPVELLVRTPRFAAAA